MKRKGGGRAAATAGNALLNIAAVGGLLCIVLVVLSGVFGISLIMFKTGSMSPGIPAGSLAVVREIPASAVRVGDVVTVDRAGMLPVTHRVTSVAGSGETRTITMRGDANDSEDPSPYEVAEVRRVLVSVPGLAHAVVWFSNPTVLGGLTLGAAALVTWAFWPKAPRSRRAVEEGELPEDGELPEAGGLPAGESPPARRGRHVAGALTIAALGVGAGLGSTALPAPGVSPAAAAAPGEERSVVRGTFLRLTSIGDPAAMRAMRPGVPVDWQIGVRLAESSAGEVDVALLASGDPELGLSVRVRSCSLRWEGGVCAGTERAVLGPGVIDVTGGAIPLGTLRGQGERWFLVTGEIPERGTGRVELALRAAGSGETAEIGADPGGAWGVATVPALLPVTGATGAWVLALGAVAGGLGVSGLVALGRARLGRGR